MKISVITVSFNSVTTIGETIQSVAAQDYLNREHLIVDGASTDGTADLIRRQSSVTRWLSEPDKGIYDAMNKGIALATGDIIGTLNADDVYFDQAVLTQVASVFADPGVDACYADLVYVDPVEPKRIVRYWRSCDFRAGLFENGWMPAHPTFFVRREIYEKYGVFDLSFPRQSDFELTMRFLAVHRIRSVYVPKIWVRMRTGGVSNNSLRGILRGNIEAYRACKKNSLDIGPLFIPKKILSRVPQFFARPAKVTR